MDLNEFKRVKKVHATFSIDEDVIVEFKDICIREDFFQSVVVQKLLEDFIDQIHSF